jgi:hypothetical protein
VTVDVESAVVHPDGRGEPERNGLKQLSVSRRQGKLGRDLVAELGERRRRSIGRALEHGNPAHVHVGGRRLDGQEGRVER